MSRRSPATRLVRSLLLVGAASAALSAAGPDALMPFRDVAGAATEVGVGFVIDFGGGSPPVVGCVKVPASDNGYAALAAFTAQVSESSPIYNSAGLLCSIDGIPANAPSVCGQQVPGGYDYWAYWHGNGGSWSYASTGAFAAVEPGDVEGWRYEHPGASNANDPKPAATPDYTAICGVIPTPTPSTAPTPAATPAAATPAATGPTAPPAATSARPSDPSAPVSGSATSRPPGSSSPPTSAPGSPSTPSTVRPTSTATSTTAGSVPRASALDAAPAASDQSSGGSAIPLMVGGLLVLLLAVGAVVGWRRRGTAP